MRLLVVCLLASVSAAQTTFKSDVRLVNVAVAVRDPGGKLVDNLTQDDFEIVEDGVPQKVAFFARSSDVPLHLGLVVDISGSQSAFVKAHQHDLKTFLDKSLSQRDRAFLICFASHPRLIVDYTSSGRKLVDALKATWAPTTRATTRSWARTRSARGRPSMTRSTTLPTRCSRRSTAAGRRSSPSATARTTPAPITCSTPSKSRRPTMCCCSVSGIPTCAAASGPRATSTAAESWRGSHAKPAAPTSTRARASSPTTSRKSATSYGRPTKLPITPLTPPRTVRSTR